MASRSKPSGKSRSSAGTRAADLLAKARLAGANSSANAAAASQRAKSSRGQSTPALPGFSALSDDMPLSDTPNTYLAEAEKPKAVPLPTLLKQMTSCGFTMREALPIAGKLIKGGFAVPDKLALLSPMALESLGVEGDDTRRKVIRAFAGKRTAAMLQSTGTGAGPPSSKRRRRDDDDSLSREWGNVAGPSNTPSVPVSFTFHEVLEESELRGRYAYINRAPVMTAWATVVLERLGFERAEALSVAHCYVAHTSTARGVSLGIIPASERDLMSNSIGPSQPHFELMGVKIPVMQIAGGKWRGISGGEVVGPEKAFNYIRKSMFQTLPLVVGALTLVADSFMEPPREAEVKTDLDEGVKLELQDEEQAQDQPQPADQKSESVEAADKGERDAADSEYGPEALHREAFHLYTLFRPETGGQWGKRARFEIDKVLALRKGHEVEWQQWQAREETECGEAAEDEAEAAQLADDIERLAGEEMAREAKLVVKTESP
ncbi:unnamed protein product [Parajaminaea phylloscopi]